MGIEVRSSPIHGFGVFARRRFRKGERIGTFLGRRTVDEGEYVLWVPDETGWRGYQGIGRLRFLNHHCDPNAEFYGRDLHARRAIAAGEEITIDYGENLADAA